MTNFNEEYYVIDRKGDKSYPLVQPQEDSEHTELYIGDNFSEFHEEIIPDPQIMEFVFAEPIPSKPVIGDYFAQPDSIISKKIANVMTSMDIKGIQLIPATVESDKGDIYEDYFYVHIYRHIEAIDRDLSDYTVDDYGDYNIDSFQLDEKILKEIPLEERMVFKLKEDGTIMLYHRSVVDAIMATNPEGVMFTKVKDWSL